MVRNVYVTGRISKKFWEELPTFLQYDMDCKENKASNNSSIDACSLVDIVMFLLSCCLAMIGGYTYRD
jgi:hypothetical protein